MTYEELKVHVKNIKGIVKDCPEMLIGYLIDEMGIEIEEEEEREQEYRGYEWSQAEWRK